MKCPFCHKELVDRIESNQDVAYYIQTCSTSVTFEGAAPLPHFERITLNDLHMQEHWYLPPYHIVNEDSSATVSIVDEKYGVSTYTRKPIFKVVFSTSERLHHDKPEKILARIKVLTLFS